MTNTKTGASQDFRQATKIARGMVTEYGMSDKLGPIFLGNEHEVFLGKSFTQTNSSFSEEVNAIIDSEVRALIDGGYNRAREILMEHMDQLHALATLLKEREKLDYDEFDRFMKGETLPAPRDINAEMNELRRQARENQQKQDEPDITE